MKKIFRLGIVVFVAGIAALGFGFSAKAQDYLSGDYERIESFYAEFKVNPDASVDVKETIKYNSGGQERHGIFRNIVLKSAQGKKVSISKISVTDSAGGVIPFKLSSRSKGAEIKIGDPDKTFSGEKEYIVSYTLNRAISYFNNFDELYWNATGDGWDFPIFKAEAKIILPNQTEPKQWDCYFGPRGATERCEYELVGQNAVLFSLPQGAVLEPGEGMTVAAGFLKGVVAAQRASEVWLDYVKMFWPVIVPIVTFLTMLWLWRKHGRDPKRRGAIVPEYTVPDNLTPLESALVLRQRIDNKDISSEIVYLATKGYIKITRLEEKILFFNKTNYLLTLTKNIDDLGEHDKQLIRSVFTSTAMASEVKLSDLKNKFYKEILIIKKAVSDSAVAKGYFERDPGKVRAKYAGFGILAVFLIVVFGFMTETNKAAFISLAVSGLIVSIFSALMPKVTESGARVRDALKGLKLYIEVAEKDRINFHNAPEKKPELFEKLLPFAMLFGSEKAWAGQFEGIYTTPPNWYSDPSGRAFGAVYFANNLSSFSSAASSTLASAPGGSGGGGFSGGGGGGGGGGSW